MMIPLLLSLLAQPVYAAIFPTIEKELVGSSTTFAAGEEFTYRIVVECNVTAQGEDCNNFILQDVLPTFTDINGNPAQLEFVSGTGSPQLGSPVESPTGTVIYSGGLPGGSATFVEITVRFPPGVTPSGTSVINEAVFGPDDGNGNPDPSDPLTISDDAPAATASSQPSQLETRKSIRVQTGEDNIFRVNENVTYRVEICSLGDPSAGDLNVDLNNAMLVDTLPAGVVIVNNGGGTVSGNTITWNLGNITIEPGQCVFRDYTVLYPSNPPTFTSPFAPGQQVVNTVDGSGDRDDTGDPFNDSDDETTVLEEPEPPIADGDIDKSASRDFVDTALDDNAAGTGDEGDSIFNYTIDASSTGNQPLDNAVVSDNIPTEFNLTTIALGTWSGGGTMTLRVYDQSGTLTTFGPFNSGDPNVNVASINYVDRVELDFGSVPASWEVNDIQLIGYPVDPTNDGTDLDLETASHQFNNTATLTADAPDGLDDVNVSDNDNVTMEQSQPAPQIRKRVIGATTVDPSFGTNITTITWEVDLLNPNSATDDFPQPILSDIVPAPLTYVAGSARLHSGPAGVGTPVIIEPAGGSTGGLIRWEFPGTLQRGERIRVRFETQVPDAAPPQSVTNTGYATTNAVDPVTGQPIDIRWDPQDDTGDLDGDGSEDDDRIRANRTINIRSIPGIDSQKKVKGPDDTDYLNNTTTRPGAQVDWRLTITNTGNVGLENVQVIDIFPHVGDNFVNQPNIPRGSQWDPNLVGPVVGPDFQIEYSTAGDPCRPGHTTGCDTPNWTTTLPADITTVMSIRVTFIADYGDGPGVLPAGQTVTFDWPMRAPTNAQQGDVAKNSFAWYGDAVGSGESISAEPPPVTVTIDGEPLPNTVGDFVFCDYNFNGLHEGGNEVGYPGVRTELWLDNNGNGIFEPGTDLFQDFTVTDPATGALGRYLFEDRPDGQYFVIFVIPAGVQVSLTDAGNNVLDSDIFWDATNSVWRTPVIDLDAAGTEVAVVDVTWDAGLLCLDPEMTLEKSTNGVDSDTPTGEYIPVGDSVTWTYEVQNTGNMIINNVQVVDNQGVPVTCPLTTLYPTFLDPASPDFVASHPLYTATGPSSMTCVVNTPYTAQAGQYANIGTVTGEPQEPPVSHPQAPPVDEVYPEEITDRDPSHYYGAEPAIDLEKSTEGFDADSAPGPYVPEGSSIQWTYRIENIGNTTLIDVTVTDSVENFAADATCDRPYPATLAPSEVMICTIDGTAIAGQYRNDANTSGTPVDSDGDPYGDPDVEDKDPSHYYGADPLIDIEKSTNGVQSDTPPGNVITPGAAVTWQYVVTNTGNINLANVTVVDDQEGNVTATCIDVSNTPKPLPMLLIPGEVVTCTASGTAQTGQYANTATATGDPADENGDPLPDFDEVEDDDPSHYLGATPAIDIQKTVYKGDDSGASCPGGELATDVNGTTVTYCFVVTNMGDTFLDDVQIDDATLGIDINDMTWISGATPLAPQGQLIYYYVDTIQSDLVNVASTSGNPTDEDGNDLPGADDPEDKDDAEVDLVGPGIKLEKTVYFGHDGGASCPGTELVQSTIGAPVTYCFVVTNTGDTPLTNVSVSDPDLSITLPVATYPDVMAIGESRTVFTITLLNADLLNTANTEGTPVDQNGDPVDDVTVEDEDTAEVEEAKPAIELQKTVYLGHDGGASCPGTELVVGTTNTAVTYCFVVTNTGNTHLAGITVNDPDLGITLSDPSVLAPNESITLYYEDAIITDLVNTASASGNPSDEDGNDLPLVDDPTDDDTAEVDQVAPAISLEKTVYQGHDGGVSCQGGELVSGVSGTAVTYCFFVTNTGDTFLNNVTVSDPLLGINQTNMTLLAGTLPLASNATLLYAYQTTITASVLNTAETSGNPSTQDGSDLPGVDDPTDEDTAEVELLGPGIQLEKTVYQGHDSGASCEGVDLSVGFDGANVTYCFLITNTGDTYLTDLLLTDPSLGITQADMTFLSGIVPLAPSESALYFYETTMTTDFVNTAATEGTPSNEDGDPLPNTPNPTDEDDAEVTLLDPAIELEKTVYLGHNGGASCEGVELVSGNMGDAVTYCFKVTNTGGTYLTEILINDPMLNINQGNLAIVSGGIPIAPGASVVYFYQTTIMGDLVNRADVIGTPSDSSGEPLPDEPKPTDVDTAEVNEEPSLELVKTANPIVIPEPGGQVQFIVDITNTSSDPITLMSLVDDPYGDLVDSTNPNLVYSTCQLATIDPAQTYQCVFAVDVQGIEGDVLTDVVTACGENEQGDIAYAEDDASVTFVPPIGSPDIEATKQDALVEDLNGDGHASPGEVIRYTIVIHNEGDAAGLSTFIDDLPDPNTSLVIGSVTTSQGVVVLGNQPGNSAVAVNLGNIEPGESVTIQFDVLIADPLPDGVTRVRNQALISGNNFPTESTDDPDTPTPGDPTDTPVVVRPELSAIKKDVLLVDADQNGAASPGDTLEYRITVANSGNQNALAAFANDQLDPNVTLIVGSVQTSQGAVVSGNNAGDTSVQVDIGTITGNGGTVVISFRVAINNPLLASVTSVSNQALISADNAPTTTTDDPDTNEEGDPTETPIIAEPLLRASKNVRLLKDSDDNGVPSPGDTLLYQIGIVNSGNGEATGVVFTDTPDPNTALVVGSVVSTQGSVNSGNSAGESTVAVAIGNLAGNGGAAEISFEVTIDNPFPANVQLVQNQGIVSSNESGDIPTDDPATPKDDDPTETPITAEPRLETTKVDFLTVDADENDGVSADDTLTYRITIINRGNTAAINATLIDTPDPNTTLVAGTVQTDRGTIVTGNGAGDTSIEVALGTIPAGEGAIITFQVTINSDIAVNTIENQASVTLENPPLVGQTNSSDDPDTDSPDDPTITPIVKGPTASETVAEPDAPRIVLPELYLPLING